MPLDPSDPSYLQALAQQLDPNASPMAALDPSYQLALANQLQPQQPQAQTTPQQSQPVAGDPFAPGSVDDFGRPAGEAMTPNPTVTSALSGHATGDLTDWTTQNLPGQAHPALGYASRVAMLPAVAGAMALDGYTNTARFGMDAVGGKYGSDITDPASQAAIMPGAVQAAMAMGAPGMGMAEEGALGAAGGKALTGAGHIRSELDALIASAGKKASEPEQSIEAQMNALLGKTPPADPFAAMHAALDAQAVPPVARTMAETGVADPSAASWRLYHGTTDPTWNTFDPAKAGLRTSGAERGALFMSPREGEAASYATGDASRIHSLDVTPGNTAVYDAAHLLATRDPRFMAASRAEFAGSQAAYDAALKRSDADVAYHQDLRGRMPADIAAEMPAYPAVSNLLSPQSATISMARQDGRDTAILRGLGESSGGDQVVALRPGFVRDANTGAIVYSGGIPGGSALAAQTPTQPDIGDPLHAALLAQANGQAPRVVDPLLEAMMAARR